VGNDHPILQNIHRRATIESFDPSREVDESTIRALVADASRAPSSFNIQHWRFVAVRADADRERLCAAAYGQLQVREAPLTFIVLGDLQGVEKLPEILDVAIAEGTIPAGKAAAWSRMAKQIYEDPQLAHDEAIRSASLAAMTLMIAAEARGLASGALIGFDPEKVKAGFGIEDRYLPVMLLSVGYAATPPATRMCRLPVDEVLYWDRCPAAPPDDES